MDQTQIILDTMWTMIAAFLVFLMNLGFGCVESGFCRSKNAVNILSKNFVVFAVSALAFWVIGWGFMFGDGSPYIGLSGLFMLSGADNSPMTGDAYQGVYSAINWTGIPLEAKFFFQAVFAATAATIVSGAVAERIKYSAFIVFATLLVAFVYPITGHWIWGGGFLATMGFWDFAGSTAVHSVGGWSALVGAMVLGPRLGRFGTDKTVHAIPGHNMSLAMIGALVLWFGWFGFNPGSTMTADAGAISHISVTTALAACAGILGGTFASVFLIGKPDIGMTINGCLAGLVAITAGCAFVSPLSAVIIGLLGGVLCVISVKAFDNIRVDDPVGAVSVHLVNGVFGTLAVGLFAEDRFSPGTTGDGLFMGGGTTLFMNQAAGVVIVGAFTVVTTVLLWNIVKLICGGLRVDAHEELVGLDESEHGNEAYPDFSAKKTREILTIDTPATVKSVCANRDDYSLSASALQKVEAIIRPELLEPVRKALKEAGYPGLTITEVEGQGRGAGRTRQWRGTEVPVDLLAYAKVDIFADKENVNKIVDIIMCNAQTGELGDGYVFVSDSHARLEISQAS